MSVEDYAAEVGDFFAEAKHPTLGRPYRDCGYQPMVELLRYLEAHGFSTYIASGGDRDFMRPIASTLYGIPRRAGDRLELRARATARTRTAARSSTRTGSTSSTTAPRSRCGSGAGSAAGRRWRAATPTATCRCCASPTACGCSCCTTTPSASSTTRAARSRRSPRAGPRSASGTTGRRSSPTRVSAVVPGWLRSYERGWLRPDSSRALVIWSVVMPQAVAYAQIAGLPPEAGLMAAPGAMLAYALLGTSRQLVVSATTATSASRRRPSGRWPAATPMRSPRCRPRSRSSSRSCWSLGGRCASARSPTSSPSR